MKVESIIDRDIVIVGQQPWDVTIGSNCKNIALELAKNNRVLYVNSAMDRITSLKNSNKAEIRKRRDVIDKKTAGLTLIQPNLWTLYPDVLIESINWINNYALFNFLNKRNNRLFSTSILRAIDQLNFKNYILFNDNDILKSFYLPELLKPEISIYYSRDYMLGVDYWKKHGERLEPELISKSTICVANSFYLRDYCRQFNPNSYYIGQGCDLDIFSPASGVPLITEIQEMKGPKIGYVGALQSLRLDMDLIAFLAEQLPDFNIILVGPEDEVFRNSRLHAIPNIHFLGSRQMEDLPRYINSFDVCINPQLINQVTIGNYPRKIDEYLAMGKPVVATLTEGVTVFEDAIYLANDKQSFVTLIKTAIQENNTERALHRRQVAESHSWENSIRELSAAISHVTTK